MAESALYEALHRHFGFAEFRPGQLAALRPIMAGRDTLVVMPTGAGKSLCYQLPALVNAGTTLVISPLIALMKDQVDALVGRGISATFINSSLDPPEQNARLESFARGDFRLVYVAPERLRNQAFQAAVAGARISLLAVDEAHCVSHWGHDFRPDYLAIRDLVPALGRPPLVALTATATPHVQTDIIAQLGLEQPERLVTGFNRPNLHFEVSFSPGETRKQLELRAFLEEFPPESAGVIYVGRRRDAEEIAGFVRDACGRTAVTYHAGMDGGERARVQQAFLAGSAPIIVATNAFGMGIDKPDVRFVVHYAIPGTVEAYYQEAGRAGRDGASARCLMLYDPADARLHEWFIENDAPSIDELRDLFALMRRIAGASGVVRGSPEQLGSHFRFQGEVKARVGLKLLAQVGLVEDLGESGGLGQWRLLPVRGRVDMQTPLHEIERHRDHKRRQLGDVLEYCQGTTCRRQFLLDYFGDATPPVADRCCDNCARLAAPAALTVAGTEAESRPLVVLKTVKGLRWGVGRGLLAKILRGARGAGMERYFEQPSFGLLGNVRQSDLEEMVDALIREGYLALVGTGRPTVSLTPRGRQAIEKKLAIPVGIEPTPAVPARPPKGETVERTFELVAAGLSPEEIADQRGLNIGTIYNHLSSLIEQGRLDLAAVVSEEARHQILAAWETCDRTFYLSPIKEALPESITYGEIRCVVAALKRELDPSA